MLLSSLLPCIAVLVFQVLAVRSLSPTADCPTSCACEENLLVNCSSLGLPKAPSHFPATATALDLSHNSLHSLAPLGSGHMHWQGLQHLWVGNNSLEILIMCSRSRGVVRTRTLTKREPRCVSWAPDLQSLSAERNQLKYLPRGLGNIKSLKVLQLSHNRIIDIGPVDLTGCTHLNELHLQHNLIHTIHPEAFKDLQKLKVLDVSHNLLFTIPVPAYLSLRNLNVLVDISGNRWRCDCSVKTIRRWLRYDRELGNPTWKVVCFSPFYHAGNNLVDLEEFDLTCPQPVYSTPGVRKEVTVDEGIELILSCSTAMQDFLHTRWWTPHGQLSGSQRFLHVTNTTAHDAGLYVCVSGYREEHVSVFNLQVRKKSHGGRLRREAQIGLDEVNAEDNHNIQRNVAAEQIVQQSEFVLAVCLSVFITFILAFAIGVIVRPFLERWYKQIRNKSESSASPPNSQTSTAQRPYVNEGYSDTDDQEQEVYEGPRVTFGGVTKIHEQGSVPYYVTVKGNPLGNVLVKNIEVHKEVPLREENIEMRRTISNESLNPERSKELQFEYIPDPEGTAGLEERSLSPASFLSGEQQESQISYEAKKSIEQSVDSPTGSTCRKENELAFAEQEAAIPGFITDPFPLKMCESKEETVDELDLDLWSDSGESFSFTEGSPRSSSRVAHVAASGHPLNQIEMSVDEPMDRPSSCNSSDSGESKGGTTDNPEHNKDSYLEDNDFNRRFSVPEEVILTEDQKKGTGARLRQDTITLDPTHIHITYIRGDSLDEELLTGYKEYFPSSNINTAYEAEPTQYHVHPVYRTSLKTTSLVGEDRTRTGSCRENDKDEQEDHTRNLEITLEDTVRSTDINYQNNSPNSTDKEGTCTYDNFFVTIGQAYDGLPKLKKSLLFSMSAPKPPHQHESTFVTDRIAESIHIPDMSHVGSSFDDSIFGMIDQTMYPIPRVKHLHFSQSQSYPPIPAPPYSTEEEIIPNKVIKTETKKFSSEDHFFVQIDASLDDLPKVKQYIQFSPSRLQLSCNSKPAAPINQVARPVSKTESPSDTINIYYEGQTISLPAMPKVKRYVQLRQSEPQAVCKHTPDIQRGSSFRQIPISFNEVPKVKQYVQFSLSELVNDSVHSQSIHQGARPAVMTKPESPSNTISVFCKGKIVLLPAVPKVQRYVQFRQSGPQSVDNHMPTIQGGNFLGQIPISFNEVPKVKQYVQFSPSESQLSNESTPSESVQHIARPVEVSKTELPSDTINIFYKGQNITLQTLPMAQRYISIRQAESHSVNEHTSTIQGGSLFEQIAISFDEVPKVKWYVRFSPTESQLSTDSVYTESVCQLATTETVLQTESPTDTTSIFYTGQTISLTAMPTVQRYVQFRYSEPQTVHEHTPDINACSFLGQIPISFEKVPKVKRHILFSRSECNDKTSLPYCPLKKKYPLKNEHVAHEIQTPLVTSKHLNAGDNFIVAIGTFLDGVPKVNRYIQFTQSEVITKTHNLLPNFTLNEMPERNHSPTKDGYPIVDEHNSFQQIGAFFDEIPKIRRQIHFTELTPQPPETHHLPGLKQAVPPALKFDANLSQSKTNFFEVIHVSLENITKVNRSLQFTKVKGKPSNQPISSFSRKIHISFDKVPKIKKYLQFIKSERPLSVLSPSTSGASEIVTPAFLTNMQTTRSKDKGSPTIKGEDFFDQTVSSSNKLPKVNKYIQFTQTEPRLSPPSLSNRTDKTIHTSSELKTEDLASEDYIQPAAGEHNIFGPIGASFETPKLKRYIQFSQSSTPPSVLPLHRRPARSVLTKPEVWRPRPSLAESQSNDEDTFFKKMDISELPKVKRHIQFMYQHSTPSKSPNNNGVTDDATKKADFWQSGFSRVEIKPLVTEDNYFGQLGTNLNSLPRVNRYIHFTKTEPHLSSQSHTPTEKMSIKEWKPVNFQVDIDTKSSKKDTVFDGVFESFDKIPKVKKSLLFTQSNNQDLNFKEVQQNFSPPKPESVRPGSLSENVSLPEKKDNFLGQLGVSLDDMPKVKKYVQFSHSKASSTAQASLNIKAQSPPPFHKTEIVTPVLSKKESNSAVFPFEKNHRTDTSFNEVPKVKRYIQFTKSALSAQSPLTSVTAEVVTSAFPTKMPTTRSEHKGSPTIKGDDFFCQTVSSFNELPKVKSYIQFTQTEPRLQPQMLHSLSNWTDKTIHASSEMKTKDLASEVYLQPAAGEPNILGPNSVSFETPKLKRYIQFSQNQSQIQTEKTIKKAPLFTQSEYWHKAAAGTTSGNDQNTVFESLDESFNQILNMKKKVQLVQSEPYLSTEEVFKQATKKNYFFGHTEGVPTLTRYRQFRQSEPHTQRLSPSISSQKWKMVDVESIESQMYKTNETPETIKDLSQLQDEPSAGKVTSDTSRLHQKSPFLPDSDVYSQPAVQEVFKLSSNSSSGDKKYATTQGSSSRNVLPTTESESTLESKLSSLGASINESAALQSRKHLVLDSVLSVLDPILQSITDNPEASLGKDNAREYLRDSSLARQRQERRRLLFQQKRRAMDGFSLSSESFTSQESDQ